MVYDFSIEVTVGGVDVYDWDIEPSPSVGILHYSGFQVIESKAFGLRLDIELSKEAKKNTNFNRADYDRDKAEKKKQRRESMKPLKGKRKGRRF